MQHLFVINPKSFVTLNELKYFLLNVENCFSVGHRAEYKTYISRFPRDALAAVHRHIESAKGEIVRIYAVGGDGVLFDCLNGMYGFENAELASVPYGNANDFVRSFGENKNDIFRNIEELSQAPTVLTDVIKCGSNYALTNCSIGLEAAAIINTFAIAKRFNNHRSLRRFVPQIYKLGAVSYILSRKRLKQYYEMKIDSELLSGEYININIGNVYGNGGINITNPYAVPDDGWLNALILNDISPLKILRMMKNYVAGNFEKCKGAFIYREFKELAVKSASPMYVLLDGELFFASELQIKVVPQSVKIVVPNNERYRAAKEKKGGGK